MTDENTGRELSIAEGSIRAAKEHNETRAWLIDLIQRELIKQFHHEKELKARQALHQGGTHDQ